MSESQAGSPRVGTGSPSTPEPISKNAMQPQWPSLRERLLRHARFALHDDALAEDIVQDTLIAVMQQHTRCRGEASLLTWSTAILKNRIIDWYRSPAHRRTVQLDVDDQKVAAAIDALYDGNGSYAESIPRWQQPENVTEERQMMAILEQCVGHLPRQTGRVFMMREWMGFETSEICERLQLNAENCRTILHRARMALRTCMQRDWIDRRSRI